MVKISQLPSDSSLNLTDRVPYVDMSAAPVATEFVTVQDLITSIFNNVPTGAIPGSVFDYVITGGVWTADSAGVNRNATMTATSIYINSRTIAISGVVARTFTASRDTYIDILDNLNGTGSLVYTEVTNNNASPALASNSIRIGIIVTGATTIAAAASVNQGQGDRVLPIASSIPYTKTDSLGNLICPRDPGRRTLGYRQIITNTATTSASLTDLTGLSVPFQLPATAAGRSVKATLHAGAIQNTTAANSSYLTINEGASVLNLSYTTNPATNGNVPQILKYRSEPSTGLHTYKAQFGTSAGTETVLASNAPSIVGGSGPAFLEIELV